MQYKGENWSIKAGFFSLDPTFLTLGGICLDMHWNENNTANNMFKSYG